MKEFEEHSHFKGETPLHHLAEKQAEGIISSQEYHGVEMAGSLQACCDSARDVAIATLLLFILSLSFQPVFPVLFKALLLFVLSFTVWKACRSCWLGWGRLERLHRIMDQEKWEIEHNRPQEREELYELYGAKGFEGKLLEDVVDVLMADEGRLLKVMIEEEMKISLETNEHPLVQGLGALIGASITGALMLIGLYLSPQFGLPVAALLSMGVASFYTAYKGKNRPINAVVWSLGMALLALSIAYFGAEYL